MEKIFVWWFVPLLVVTQALLFSPAPNSFASAEESYPVLSDPKLGGFPRHQG